MSTSADRARADDVASTESASQEDVAAYVATLARDLKRLVARHDLATLTYLLEIVQLEAQKTAGRKPSSPAD